MYLLKKMIDILGYTALCILFATILYGYGMFFLNFEKVETSILAIENNAYVAEAMAMDKTYASDDLSENTSLEESDENVHLDEGEVPKKETGGTKHAKISAVGDLMVHKWQLTDAYDDVIKEYDFEHNFNYIKKYFAASDIVVGNLETTFAGGDSSYTGYPNFNTPNAFATALKNAGFNVLSTANNHSYDMLENGLNNTIDVLNNNNIDHFGTSKSQEERDSILIKDVDGIKIAFLSYTYGTNGMTPANEYNVNMLDEEIVVSDIKKSKELGCDLTVVMPHMGVEYEAYTEDVYKNWVDLMFNAGADIILASHPHVLQPMEYRTVKNSDGTERKCFVIYSLGNFISSQTKNNSDVSIILNIDISKEVNEIAKIDKVSFIPIWTQSVNVLQQNHFAVRSIYDVFNMEEEERSEVIRKTDFNYLEEIYYKITGLFLQEKVSIEEIRNEYVFE